MSIKFIVDSLKEHDRKQLESIKRIVNEKPTRVSKETIFLRKFTLAILQQYNQKLKFTPKVHEEKLSYHNLPNTPRKINLQFNIPRAPSPIKLDVRLEPLKKIEL